MKQKGFTLLEVLLTITLAVILVAIAAPGFRALFSGNQLTTEANRFITAVNLARSEAISRATRVTLCQRNPGASPPQCSGSGSYSNGWLVFTDPDGDAVFDSGEELIREFEAMANGVSAQVADASPVGSYLSFIEDGTARTKLASGNDLLPANVNNNVVLSKDGDSRTICISTVGRPDVCEN